MRVSRSQQLPQNGGIVHKFWRCHNREYLLRPNSVKALYLRSTVSGLKHKKLNNEVKLQAFCIMDNHSHQVVRYTRESKSFSGFMRKAHSQFGAAYNKDHGRSGKVANERPRTPLIQDSTHAVRVHLYVEANPIRAGRYKAENLKQDRFNSFRFYAYGITDEYTKHLEVPDWYLSLGKNPQQRQKRYRSLFYFYLKQSRAEPHGWIFDLFIGDALWTMHQKSRVQDIVREKKKSSERDPPDSS